MSPLFASDVCTKFSYLEGTKLSRVVTKLILVGNQAALSTLALLRLIARHPKSWLVMLHPTIVNICSFFYPIGNTPAVCLTQDLSREQGADILLLGCGDIRNILFTIYSDNGSSMSTSLR